MENAGLERTKPAFCTRTYGYLLRRIAVPGISHDPPGTAFFLPHRNVPPLIGFALVSRIVFAELNGIGTRIKDLHRVEMRVGEVVLVGFPQLLDFGTTLDDGASLRVNDCILVVELSQLFEIV